MEKARRRHVPAFGEWNYYYHYDEPELPPPALAAANCYDAATPEAEACSDVWFRYSPPPPPPPRKPAAKKTRRPPPPQGEVVASEKQGRRLRAFDGARAPAKGASCRVVRPVDEDLYQVPPPEFSSRRPRRKRSLLMGCLGLNNCVA